MVTRRSVTFLSFLTVFACLPLAALRTSAEDPKAEVVTYEAFGAVGDGVHDDLPAICRAHEHANAQGLPVKSKPEATYHLGRRH